MSNVIDVTIRNKVASTLREHEIEYICGNSGFVVAFDFDDEWDAFDTKTARFKYNGTHQDVVFSGNRVNVPIIENTNKIHVGVFAGNQCTTTPAVIMAEKSILCGSGTPAAPSDDVYKQIMELLNNQADDTAGSIWIDLGVQDDVYAAMDEILEDGFYRLSDGEFVFSLQVDRTSDRYVGQTYWSEEEGRSLVYFRAGWYSSGELEWDDWQTHVNDATLTSYALKNHKHIQVLNTSDFESWIKVFREGQHQINIHAEAKSYIVDQFVFNNKPTTTIHVCQRYFEVTEPWKVYARHGTTNGNYVLVEWEDWHEC